MKNKKGFTLIELLAVIIVLALIMIIAIPAVLNKINMVKKKSFMIFANKVYDAAEKKVLKDMLTDQGDALNKYNLATDLGITEVGEYEGYVVIASCNKKRIIKLYMWDDNFEIVDKTIGEVTEPENVEDNINTKVNDILNNNVTSCNSFIEYTINLDYDGGLPADVTLLTVKGNYPITGLTTPAKDGYIFKGWYDGSTQYRNNDLLINYNLNRLTAVYDACPRGYTCKDNKSTINKYICTAGTYLPSNELECVPCPAGSYCVGGTYTFNENDDQGSNACGSNSYTNTGDNPGASTCTVCPIGSSCNGKTATSCASGSYSTETGATSCTECPVGYYCTGGTNKISCGSGKSSLAGAKSSSDCYSLSYQATQTSSSYNASESTSGCYCSCGGFNGVGHCNWHVSQGQSVSWVSSYSCPNGGTLSGSKCYTTTYTCPNGGTLNTTTHMCEF